MKYLAALLLSILLLAGCKRNPPAAEPTGSYDTLGVKWMTLQRTDITYYFQGTGLEAAVLFANMHDEAYKELNGFFQAKLPQKLRFFVWTDWAQAEQALGHPLGFAVPTECVINATASQTLGHEITHILSFWGWDELPATRSKFINEGLAVAFDLSGRDKLADARDAINGQNIPGIADIWSGKYRATDEILYPVGGAFMDFMHKRNEPEKFKALVKNQLIEDAEIIYGKEQLQVLISDFEKQLGL